MTGLISYSVNRCMAPSYQGGGYISLINFFIFLFLRATLYRRPRARAYYLE